MFSLRYSTGEEVHEIAFGEITGEVVELEQQIEAMVRAAREGTPPPVTGTDGRWSVLLCLAAQQSANSGCWERAQNAALNDSLPSLCGSSRCP